MKIVYAADTYPPDISGAATFARDLAVGMSKRGHEVHVIAPSPSAEPYRRKVDGVIEHRMRSHEYPLFKGFYICMPWEVNATVTQILHKLQPDVVHTQAHFVVGRYTCKWANRLDLPLVATNHFMPENLVDHLPIPVPRFLVKAGADLAWNDLGQVYRRADRLTAPTANAVNLLRTRAHLGGAVPVSCGIDSPKYLAAAKRAPQNQVPRLLFVGRLEQEKRVNEVIEALSFLGADTPLHFDVVGDGSKRAELEAQARALGVADRVTFHGFVSDQDLVDFYGRCDIFVNAGIAELQSIVTLEALSAAKPVVLANAVALPHLVRDGQNGFLFEPGDTRQLSQILAKLAKDPDLRHRLGQVSLSVVAPHSFENTLNAFTSIYEDAIDKVARGRHSA